MSLRVQYGDDAEGDIAYPEGLARTNTVVEQLFDDRCANDGNLGSLVEFSFRKWAAASKGPLARDEIVTIDPGNECRPVLVTSNNCPVRK